jgi:phosphoglycolate phosphatase
MTPRAVAFDFDGTLVDSNAIKRGAFDEVAEAYPGGAKAVGEIIAQNPNSTRHEIFAALARHVFPDDGATERLAREMVGRYTELTRSRISVCPEIPGATQIVAELTAQGYRLAVNSSTPAEALLEILDRKGWRSRFALILGSPATKEENLRCIAAGLRVSHKDMVMVGDREADRRAALAAGCPFVALTRPDSDFAGPLSHRISQLKELPGLLVRSIFPTELRNV